ncbi:hypothetical protein LSCM1_02433 [Leishmania martiniquensis]|uniref:Uncharacterized protein n=1 Tax=Leishmania martiniquensis TaxID=1580590 RepID=A0A836GR57_9TRYP|nr:hypothetical protein LSCM1_02433 [Leishmania martiniquensis]
MMRRSRCATVPQRLLGTALSCDRHSRVIAPPRHPLLTSTRQLCMGSTRVFHALPHRPQAPPLSSYSHSSVNARGTGCEKAALESPPPPPPPSSETAVSSPAVSATAPEEVAAFNSTGNCKTETGSKMARDATSAPLPLPPLLQDSLLRRLLASWQQGVVASIGAVMGIGFLMYFLYTPVKEDTVHHTAVVASEALADARLKGQAVQLSKDVVLEVLRNPQSLDATVDVVVDLLAREETKIAVSSLLQSLFEDHYTQEVTKKFVLRVVQDPWIQDQLQVITEEQVRKLLNNAGVKTELSKFLLKSALDSLEKPQLHYEVAKAIRHSAASLVNFWWR